MNGQGNAGGAGSDQPPGATVDFDDPEQFTKSDAADLAAIEKLLDVRPGTLRELDFYVGCLTCENCGRVMMGSDIVNAALQDAKHSKAHLLHTLLSNKAQRSSPRPPRCRGCNALQKALFYGSGRYRC